MSGSEHFGRDDQEKLAAQGSDLHPPMDRRALRTRRALHEALIGLIIERDYDGISVSDIADAANVGRSTFYAHFTDKDDLLRSGTDQLRRLLFQEHESAIAGEDRADRRTLGFSRFMTEHLRDRQTLYRGMMRGRAGPIILDKVRQYLGEIVRAELKGTGSGKTPEIAVQFVVGAYMSVLTWWLDRGAKEPPEEIDRAFRELALGGLGALLGH